MGEVINLIENFKVEKVIFNCGEFNDLGHDLIKVLDKKKIPYYSCIKELNIDNNKLYFLNNKIYDNENDNSSVVYTELNNHKFLFMGDAGVEVEEDLIEKYNLQNIDVLKGGHHGSRTSSSKVFIDEINPKYSIISVGKNNRYGHPNDYDEIIYYINISKKNNLTQRQLQERIKSKEYQRLPIGSRNTLVKNEYLEPNDLIPNPIRIKNINNYDDITEKILQRLILEDIPTFLKELGNGFTFIDNEYKIKIGDRYNYIDLLLYNIEYSFYVVVELKVTELKKEYIGQIQVYMNYIDENLRKFNEAEIIGIIICKQENKYVIKYCSDDRIIAREYELV